MAGNTKLIGFHSSTRALRLERWGSRADFTISPESISQIDAACRALPNAPTTPSQSLDDDVAEFDEARGVIGFRLNHTRTTQLIEFLTEVENHILLSDEETKLIDSWRGTLQLALDAREAWFDSTDEPGVENADTDS